MGQITEYPMDIAFFCQFLSLCKSVISLFAAYSAALTEYYCLDFTVLLSFLLILLLFIALPVL